MRFTYCGHSCLLIETERTRIVIDPGSFSTVDELGRVDAVLVTHQHADHLDVERLRGLIEDNEGLALHTDPGSAEQLEKQDLSVHVNRPGESYSIGDITVTPAGEQHAFNHPYVPTVPNVGVLLEGDGVRLFHPGDALDAEPGPVDYLAVPVSAPWTAVRDGIEFVRRIAPARGIIPIHDALLSEAGRRMYLMHLGNFGLEGGVEVLDGADRRARDLP
jgi:L-ascorbate metabolism protein UlaG (beta-lactamase superfamily)